MEFKRTKIYELANWKARMDRKPLILNGARQVGKTTLVKAFGEEYFGQVAYFNFEREPEIHDFFKVTKDPMRIIRSLSLVSKHPITEHTLIFLDEIQACGDALTALKYFKEEAPEYAVIAAGSLLGVSLGQEEVSFPVGKVEFMDLHPLTFSEFLMAVDGQLFKAFEQFASEKVITPLSPVRKIQGVYDVWWYA